MILAARATKVRSAAETVRLNHVLARSNRARTNGEGNRTGPTFIARSTIKAIVEMEVETSSDSARWEDMSKLVMRGSAFPMEQGSLATGVFEPGPEVRAWGSDASTCAVSAPPSPRPSQTMSFIQNDCKVLVIGAGGLGCEVPVLQRNSRELRR